MNPKDPVRSLINCLTNDEDKRQELWLHYLSGNDASTLVTHLQKITQDNSIESDLQGALWDAFKNPPSDKFQNLLSRLSKIEQDVVCLLALGLSISEISGYKRISEIRIRQVVSIIRENDCWEELYGIEEKING